MQEAADRLAAEEEENNFSKGRNMITRLMEELEKEPATEVRFHPFEKLSAADTGSGVSSVFQIAALSTALVSSDS